jgi:hypothetical protein
LLEKLENSPSQISFWRTKDGAEVDFVIKGGSRITPVEVKYKRLSRPEITRSLHSFISAYHPDNALVVNLDYKGDMSVGETKVLFLPFYELMMSPIRILLQYVVGD